MGRSKLKAQKSRGFAPRLVARRVAVPLPALHPRSDDESEDEDENADVISGEGDFENDEDRNVTDREEKDAAMRIRASFSEVLSSQRKSSYCYNQTYHVSNIPNPLLKIAGFDFLGVPVNGPTARDIVPFFQPYSTEKNFSQTTRFLASEKVTIMNAKWDEWVHDTVLPPLYRTLDIKANDNTRCHLHQILLQEPGLLSQKYPETPGDDSKTFGYLHVVLPSIYAGCIVDMLYQDRSTTIEVEAGDGLTVNIFGYYTGVSYTFAPLTSGYRLSLVYRLTQTSDGDFPVAPDLSKDLNLQLPLSRWKEVPADASPPLLALLLDHDYDDDSRLSTHVLKKGPDTRLLDEIIPVASQLGFRLVLSRFTHTQECVKELPVDWSRARHFQSSDDWCDLIYDVRTDNLSMDNRDFEETIEIRDLFALSGRPVSFSDGAYTEIEGTNLLGREDITERSHESDFEFTERNYGVLTHIRKAAALLIWRHDANIDIVTRGDAFDYAFDVLETSTSTSPVGDEDEAVGALLDCCEGAARSRNPDRVRKAFSVLCGAAMRWKDNRLFQETTQRCCVASHLEYLDNNLCKLLHEAFGWPSLKQVFTKIVTAEISNKTRYEFVDRLSHIRWESNAAVVREWCETQSEAILDKLRCPDSSEIEWLIEIVKQRGFIFFRERILSQLETFAPYRHDFWRSFALALYRDYKLIPEASSEVVQGTVNRILQQYLKALPTLPTVKQKASAHFNVFMIQENPQTIIDAVQLCVRVQQPSFCSKIFVDMRKSFDSREPAGYINEWLFGLVMPMNKLCLSEPALTEYLDLFFETAAVAIIRGGTSATRGPEDFENLGICCNRVVMGRLPLLKKLLNTAQVHALAVSQPEHLRSLALYLHRKFRPMIGSNLNDNRELTQVVSPCVREIVTNFPFESFISGTRVRKGGYRVGHKITEQDIIELLQFIFDCGPEASSAMNGLVVDQLYEGLRREDSARTFDRYVPILNHLVTFFVQRNLPLTNDPLKGLLSSIVQGHIRHNLQRTGPWPQAIPDSLRTIGCGCGHCRSLGGFFNNGQKSISFKAPERDRKHLSSALERVGSARYGVVMETIKERSPYTLMIIKPDSMLAHGAWLVRSRNAQVLCRSLGDETVQQQIFGQAFDWVRGMIAGAVSTAPAPPVPTDKTGGSKKRGSGDSGSGPVLKKRRPA
ncbi:hypothetical protein PQX77_002428 [Marasmius sp. AFHP31]|nr:hypothetical protein PQX77_002428 [Marasmius sp. AFHP31]